jgi:cobalt/nickel transport system permease protein
VHLADGIVSQAPLVVSLNLLGACGVGAALGRSFGEQRRGVAWTGTLAAFVLAAQALNLPVVPGASAHAVGAGLLCFTLGPARAIVALFAVLLVQALTLGDGGITVLGVNALNLAVLPVLIVHGCRLCFGESKLGLAAAALVGTLLGNVVGAASLSSILVSGAGAPPGFTFAWLIGVQALAGAVEGTLTALAVRRLRIRAPELVLRTRPDPSIPAPLDAAPPTAGDGRALRAAALALGITVALLPLASSTPDALESLLTHLSLEP